MRTWNTLERQVLGCLLALRWAVPSTVPPALWHTLLTPLTPWLPSTAALWATCSSAHSVSYAPRSAKWLPIPPAKGDADPPRTLSEKSLLYGQFRQMPVLGVSKKKKKKYVNLMFVNIT